MPSPRLREEEFKSRFRQQFIDPAFAALDRELEKITDAAWDAYAGSRKSPQTKKAGPEFADPDYDLSPSIGSVRAMQSTSPRNGTTTKADQTAFF